MHMNSDDTMIVDPLRPHHAIPVLAHLSGPTPDGQVRF